MPTRRFCAPQPTRFCESIGGCQTETVSLGYSTQRKPPRQLFLKLFAGLLQWVYHCFDRIVIHGYLSFLTREANVVYFFRQVGRHPVLSKEVLSQRTRHYQHWVEAFARNHHLPIEWAPPDVRQEDRVRPFLARRRKQASFGVYFIFRSMEQGPSFRIALPKYPTADPNYRLVRKQRSRYTHYYFYIFDEVVGPMIVRIGSFLPFPVTGYFNGHHFMERELIRHKIPFQKQDNRFLRVSDRAALQAAADRLDGVILQKRLDYWTYLLGPKFSLKERQHCHGLHRLYALSQVEYCRNFIFKRRWPIDWIFHRACELGLYLVTGDRIAQLFGQRLTRYLHGKCQTVVERMKHGQHVFRIYCRHSLLKAYQKAATFLRLEIVCNNLKDFGLKKTLPHWQSIRARFLELTDSFAELKAQHLNVHGHFDLVAQLAQPVLQGKTKVAGIKLENTRLLRLLQLLQQKAAGHFGSWTSAQLHGAYLDQYQLKASAYTLNQLRYDLRKLRLHGIIERIPHSYSYRFTSPGLKSAILMLQLRNRIYGPLAFALLRRRPAPDHTPASPLEHAYAKVEKAIDHLVDLLAA